MGYRNELFTRSLVHKSNILIDRSSLGFWSLALPYFDDIGKSLGSLITKVALETKVNNPSVYFIIFYINLICICIYNDFSWGYWKLTIVKFVKSTRINSQFAFICRCCEIKKITPIEWLKTTKTKLIIVNAGFLIFLNQRSRALYFFLHHCP